MKPVAYRKEILNWRMKYQRLLNSWEKPMQIISAVCQCRDFSEDNKVVAIKQNRFAFVEEWGVFIWIAALLMVFITGGFWIFLILGWHLGDVLNPIYTCNQCNAEIQPKQFRS